MDFDRFEDRKRDHMRHAMDSLHQANGLTGLGSIRLLHEALPDLDLDAVSLQTSFLGKDLATPFYVAGMTAGHAGANDLNLRLARACAQRGWVLGVGSQRRELEEPYRGDRWLQLREEAPGLRLVANLGISQIISSSIEAIQQVVQSLQADLLAIHLNPLQEALQPEGTPQFAGAEGKLKELIQAISVPVMLKETGCGMSRSALQRFAGLSLAAVDVSGLGGTHWGRIEGARALEMNSEKSQLLAKVSETFANWGVPTVQSVQWASQVLPAWMEIWASGGVRSGLDAAKLMALGAHRVGFAQPALEAALAGDEALDFWMKKQELELRIALFCTGCADPDVLRQKGSSVWTNA